MIPHKRIIFIGNEGAGKGTQIKLLQKKLRLPVIAVGVLLRAEIQKNTALGKNLKPFVDSGRLAPNELVNKLIESKILKYRKTGFILDGYPRDPEQIGFLFSLTTMDIVVGVIISRQEIRNRVLYRRQCARGHMYNLKYFPPKKSGVCDLDGLKLFRRKDLTESAIRQREEVFKTYTSRVIQAFKNFGLYVEINGEQKPEKIHRDIMEKLASFDRCP